MAIMSRPKSMSDFASLLDTSYQPLAGISEKQRPRKKGSISLATGLIMASDMQSRRDSVMSPRAVNVANESGYSEALFYAYAQKVCIHYLSAPLLPVYPEDLQRNANVGNP